MNWWRKKILRTSRSSKQCSRADPRLPGTQRTPGKKITKDYPLIYFLKLWGRNVFLRKGRYRVCNSRCKNGPLCLFCYFCYIMYSAPIGPYQKWTVHINKVTYCQSVTLKQQKKGLEKNWQYIDVVLEWESRQETIFLSKLPEPLHHWICHSSLSPGQGRIWHHFQLNLVMSHII
jgi:hypothetical protein